jgi:broad specificity phosphatase PhoE
MGQVFLVRHAQASFASDDYDQLSDLGVTQARLLAAWFTRVNQRFTHAAMGTLRRHAQTAEAFLGALPEPLRPPGAATCDGGFDEYDSGDVIVRHRPDLADRGAIQRFIAQSPDPRRAFQEVFARAMERWARGQHDHDYREPWRTFRARCVSALERTIAAAGGSREIVIVSSGGPIAAICQHVTGMSDAKAVELNWSLVNSSVTRLLYGRGRVSLHVLNAYPHLEAADAPGCVTYR